MTASIPLFASYQPTTVEEQDGSPSVDKVRKIKVTNGKLTDDANGDITLDLSGQTPVDATYITQTANGTLTNEQALSSLSTGLMKVTTSTGVISSITDSAGLAGVLSDETGSSSGVAVFSNGPTIASPVITNINPGADFTLTQNSVTPFVSVATSAAANTLYLKAGNVGIGSTAPGYKLDVNGTFNLNGTTSFTGWDTDSSNDVATTRTISTTAPLAGGGDLSANRTLSIADAVADGSTKGAASFTANDFDASSGNISLDYTNGQAASGSTKGFLTSGDWTTFNGKLSPSGTLTGLVQTAAAGINYFNGSGNVGIGTTTPGYKLAVNGTLDATTITQGGTAVSLSTHNHAGVYQPADADLDNWAAKTAPSGTVVGTTDIQTLTNKTLTSGTYDPTNATSDILTLTGTALTSGNFLQGSLADVFTTDTALMNFTGTALDTATNVTLMELSTTAANDVDVTAIKLERGTDDAKIVFDEGTNKWRIDNGDGAGLADISTATTSGETNTASNLGGGLANYDSKSSVDLRFNSFSGTDFDLASNLFTIDASLTRDAEWNTESEVETAWSGANIIIGTELDTSAKVKAIVTDETGSGGALVFATGPTLSSPIITNIAPGANFTLTQNSVTPFVSESASAAANTLYLKAGNVGIGSTSPGFSLDILKSQNSATGMALTNTNGSTLSRTNILFGNGTNTAYLMYNGTGNTSFGGANSFNIYNEAASPITFLTGGDEKMRVDGGGNIGIGTTGPARLLNTYTSSALTNTVSYNERLTHITSGTPANGIGVGLEFEQETTSNNNEIGAVIETTVSDVTGGSEDFDLAFKTMTAGAAATAKMTIKSPGYIEIGSGTNTNATGAGELYVAGDLEVDGTIYGTVSETDPVVKAINGLVKSNGSTISAATANTDYEPALTDSASLSGTISDETGSGLAVFATSPSLTTPNIGVATATSVNKVALTAPATGSTLTILDGKTLTANNSLTLAGTDSTTLTFQGTDTYVGRATTDTLTNKTLTSPVIGNISPSADFTLTQNSVTPIVSVATSAAANTLYLKQGNVGIGSTAPTAALDVVGNIKASGTITGTITETDPIVKAISGLVKSNGSTISAATANTDYEPALTDSASLSGTISDETGSGAAVFGTGPTISSPVITNIAPGADFTLTQNSVAPFTSVNSGAVVNTLYLKAGNVGIGTTAPNGKFVVASGTAGSVVFGDQYRGQVDPYARVEFSDPTGGGISDWAFDNQALAGSAIIGGSSGGTYASRSVYTYDAAGFVFSSVGGKAIYPTNMIVGLWSKIHDGTDFEANAEINLLVDAATGNNDAPGAIGFATTSDGSTTLAYRMMIRNSGFIGIGTTGPARLLNTYTSSALTNTVSYNERLTHITSGTPANGIGVGLEFEQETTSNNNEVGAVIETTVSDVTGGSEDFDLAFKTMTAGAAATAKMTIKSPGYIEIGSGTNTNATGAGELYVAGDLEVDGTIYGTVSETDPVVKAINGLVKSNGSTISAATANTDYEPALTDSASLATTLSDETGSSSGVAVFNNGPTITSPVITNISPGADFSLTQNAVTPFVSVATSAAANTLYLKQGNVGIGTTSPALPLQVLGAIGAEGGASAPNGVMSINSTSGVAAVSIGVTDTSAHGWIQARNKSSATFYTLKLNPSGGAVVIGDSGNSDNANVKLTNLGNSIMGSSGYIGLGQFTSAGGGFANLVSDANGSAALTHNLYLDSSSNLYTSKTHASIAGSAIRMPGNGVARAGYLEFWTTPTGSVTAGNAYAQSSPRMLIDTGGNVGIGTTSPARLLNTYTSSALTNTVSYNERLTHITSGTPANGIGVGLEFEQETTSNNNEVGAVIETTVSDVTGGSEDFDLAFKTMTAGAAATAKMTIKSPGYIEIGSGTNTNSTGAGDLYVAGDLEVDGTLYATVSGMAPSTATYITQTADGTLSAEQALSSLSTGLMQVTTTTGVISSVTTSAGISGLLSDETGSGGALVFATNPTISSPVITNIAPGADFTLTQNSVAPFTSVNSGAVANTLYLKAGNVGIGSTAPSRALDVNGDINAANYVRVGNLSALGSGSLSLYASASTIANSYSSSGAAMSITGGANASSHLDFISTSATGTSDYIKFQVGSAGATEAMRIINSGNVGIGSTSPGVKLDVTGAIRASTSMASGVVNLTDAATIATDASLGNTFYTSSATDRTLGAPTNPTAGQKCVWRWKNTDASSRTLTLTTGSAGAFRYGSTITATTATAAGKTDYIGAVYNAQDDRWDVIAYSKGY